MKTGTIYIGTIRVISKAYVGQTIKPFKWRKNQHLRNMDRTPFQLDIQKYGRDAVDWEVLESDVPESQILKREAYWIKVKDTCYPKGYNMSQGDKIESWLRCQVSPDSGFHSNRYIAEQCNASNGLVLTKDKELKERLGDAYERPSPSERERWRRDKRLPKVETVKRDIHVDELLTVAKTVLTHSTISDEATSLIERLLSEIQ